MNWQDYEGRTPLHFAVADGNEAVVEVLTSYEGCNVTAYDNLFRTPLHWAALLGGCPQILYVTYCILNDNNTLELRISGYMELMSTVPQNKIRF